MPLQPPGQPSDNPDNDFRGASIPNIIGYRFTDLDPGSNIYIQRDDKLVVQAFSTLTNEVLNVNVRLLQPGHPIGRTQPDPATADNRLGDSPFGVIVPMNVMVRIPTATTTLSQTVELAEGYLLSVAISATSATVRGQTFVRAFILRGSANVANVAYLLAADYATTFTSVGWPFGDVRQSTDGQGLISVLGYSAPAAGVDFLISTPVTSGRAMVLTAQATLTTSAAVANRIVTASVVGVGGVLPCGTFPASQAIPASTVAKVSFAPGAQGNALTPTIVNVQLPQLVFVTENAPQNIRLIITTINLQAADQWSAIGLNWQNWADF